MSRSMSFSGKDLRAEEAERFMALLLAAQNSDHDCPWIQYFRDIAKRIIKQYDIDFDEVKKSGKRRKRS